MVGAIPRVLRELLPRGVRPAEVARLASPAWSRRSCFSTRPALLRPSIQQSDARRHGGRGACAEIEEEAFLARAGNGINQQLIATKLRWVERHEPEVFARRDGFRLLRLHQLALIGVRGIEQNWALEAGLIDIKTHEIEDDLVALTHVRRDVFPAKVVRIVSWERQCSRRGGDRSAPRDCPFSAARPITSPRRWRRVRHSPATCFSSLAAPSTS